VSSDFRTDITAVMRRWCSEAFTVAEACCRNPLPDRHAGCRGYHGVRPFLFASGLRTSFDVYEEMFRGAVQQWSGQDPRPRVLISGAADFLVPAVVTRSLQEAGKDPLVTIVDRCETPLVMCEDAGRRLRMRWETSRNDVAAHQRPAAYDLIVSDRLLGFIAPSRRLTVIRAWRNQLACGGRLITTISVHPAREGSDGDDTALLDAVQNRFEDEYRSLLPGIQRAELLRMIENYNNQRRSHRIGSADEVVPLFRQCGLEIFDTPKFRKRTDAGLPVDRARYMLQIIAG
jgi:hypothetical protein